MSVDTDIGPEMLASNSTRPKETHRVFGFARYDAALEEYKFLAHIGAMPYFVREWDV